MVIGVRVSVISGLLLLGLIGLLITYVAVVNDLPSQIYSASQLEYLRYNVGRSIAQLAPIWNIIDSDGQIAPTLLPVRENHVRAILAARYEEHEGVSVTVYDLDFRGEYRLTHPGPVTVTAELYFPFPNNLETLHEVSFLVDGEEPPGVNYTTQGISWATILQHGDEHQIVISYQADGANRFAYSLHHDQRTDVDIAVTVEGLTGSQVARSALPPTKSEVTDGGETFTWNYTGLIADRDIQLILPTHLSFAQRITQLQEDFRTLARLAPILVGLFLASLVGALHLSGIHLRLESYLLAGFGLALFYPTLTFTSGVVGVTLASVLAFSLVAGLVLVFLGRTIGRRDILWPAGLLLIIFLGFFSLGMLTSWRGLLVSVGGLLLVGTFMLLYARQPVISEPEFPPQSDEIAPKPEPELVPPSDDATPEQADLYCLQCGHLLVDYYSYCPGCGYDISHFRRCVDCGHKHFVPAGAEAVHCIHCGQSLK